MDIYSDPGNLGDPLDAGTLDLSFQDASAPVDASLSDLLRSGDTNPDGTPADAESGALDTIYAGTSDILRDASTGTAPADATATPMDIGGFFAQLGAPLKLGGTVLGGIWSAVTGQKVTTPTTGTVTPPSTALARAMPLLLIAAAGFVFLKLKR